jgi:hypothetical protein
MIKKVAMVHTILLSFEHWLRVRMRNKQIEKLTGACLWETHNTQISKGIVRKIRPWCKREIVVGDSGRSRSGSHIPQRLLHFANIAVVLGFQFLRSIDKIFIP